MGKKYFMLLFLLLTGVLMLVYMRVLPVEVAGYRPGNVPLLMANIIVVAVATALILTLCLFSLLKRSYIRTQFATFKRYRHLLFLMVKRDFVTRYRRNVLGVLWSVLNPLFTMLVLATVLGHLLRHNVPYFPVFLLSGQVIFNFFSESTSRAMNSVIGGAGIIKKIYVPKYIFPVSNILSSLVNMGFSFIAFLGVMLVTRLVPFSWTLLLTFIPVIYVLIFALGVGMLLSSMSVFFRDLGYLYGVGITLWMFLTPVIYPVSILSPRVHHAMHLNPMYHYVNYFRDLALYGTIPGLWSNIICLGFALGAFCVGLYAMVAQQDKYILYL